jgi:transmembrane sensor
MSDSEKIAELIFRYLRDELSEDQLRELNEWRESSPQNEQIFREETDLENIRSGLKEMYDNKDKVWQKILEKAPQAAIQPVHKRVYLRVWAAAAIFLIVLGCGMYILSHYASRKNELSNHQIPIKQDIPPGGNHATLVLANGITILLDTAHNGFLTGQGGSTVLKQDSGLLVYRRNIMARNEEAKMEYNIIQIPRGGEFSLLLPDGTKVWLNSASSLRYPTAFSTGERSVELTGEGYFEVAKSKIPFYVVMGDHSLVEVLGTHFNIMAYTDEPYIATTLLEGRVKVTKGNISQIIKPGEQAKIIDTSIQVLHEVDVANAVAWKNGRILFKDADIETIMRLVSRWYNVDVEYSGIVKHRSISGGISRNANFSELLKILELNNIHFTMEGKKIKVNP